MEYRVPLTEIPWKIALLALPAKIVGTLCKYHSKFLKALLLTILMLVIFGLVLELAHILADEPGPIKQIVEMYDAAH